jgi:ArsR family transcriptional regulator
LQATGISGAILLLTQGAGRLPFPALEGLAATGWLPHGQRIKKRLDKINCATIIRYMSKNRNKNIHQFAEIFKALSNPNRLKIFMRLSSCCQPGTVASINRSTGEVGCACVGELGQDLGIVASTLSHHIKELRRAGLIRMERRGQKMECWIDPETLSALRNFF